MNESATPAVESAPAVEESASLSDHIKAFHGPVEERTPIEAPTAEDEDAEPAPVAEPEKPARHRAESQKAGADDIVSIAALAREIAESEEAEAKIAGITQKDGESPRVFKLRRRAELNKWRKTEAAKPAPSAPRVETRQAETRRVDPATPLSEKFPDFAAWATGDKAAATYEDYIDARTDHRMAKAEETRVKEKMQADARADGERMARDFQGRIDAAKAKYKDFQAVALDAPTRIPAGSAIDVFILDDEAGADVLYHLQQHGDELDGLLAKNPLQQVKALSLLAQRLTTPTSAAAGTTGAAPRTTSQPAPKPPTPVRGGPSRPADEPPAEDAPLSAHERFFHKR